MQEITKTNIEKAHKNHLIVLQLGISIKRDLWDLAVVLKVNRDNKYYKILGYETFESYLATPEISLSRFFVYKIIRNVEVWVEDYKVEIDKLQDIDSEKLYITGTMISGLGLASEEVMEVLEQARTLSRSDVKQLKSGEEYDPKRYKMVTCPKCGEEFKVVL